MAQSIAIDHDNSSSAATSSKSKTFFLPSPPAACISVRNNHVLIGTYTLNEETAARSGNLILYKLVRDDDSGNDVELNHVQTLNLSDQLGAILDIRHVVPPPSSGLSSSVSRQDVDDDDDDDDTTGSFNHNFSFHNLIAVATSTGHVVFYKTNIGVDGMDGVGEDIEILEHSVHAVFDSSVLVLSIMFHPIEYGVLVCTLSSGDVVILRMEQGDSEVVDGGTESRQEGGEEEDDNVVVQRKRLNLVEMARCESVHTGLEVWTSGFSLDGGVLYTGGDDGVFCRFAFDKGNGGQDGADAEQDEYKVMAQTRDRKTHGAGVTAMLSVSLPVSKTELVLTGSYDCHLRIYNPTTRRFLNSEINLDGGVWRLETLVLGSKVHGNERKSLLILASCMHAGCRVIEVVEQEAGNVVMNVVGRMEEHESMNYASAALRDEKGGGQSNSNQGWTIVSTSFYDKRVCVWRIEDSV